MVKNKITNPQAAIRVVIDITKGQQTLILREFKDLQSRIISSDMVLSSLLDEPLSFRKIEHFDVLIIISPFQKYKPHEIRAMLQFVDAGGGILVLSKAGGDKLTGTNLSSLLKHFKLKLGESKVLDLNPSSIDPNSINGITIPTIPGLIEHDLLIYNCVSIIADISQVLITSSSVNGEKEYHLAAWGEKGLGRLIVFGSTSVFDDSEIGLKNSENLKILIRIIRWLSHKLLTEQDFEDITEISPIKSGTDTDTDNFENLIKNLLPEISEIVDKDDLIKEYSDSEFEVESTVIRILRSFLANALRDSHTKSKDFNYLQIEGFEQVVMFLNRISNNIEKLTDLIEKSVNKST